MQAWRTDEVGEADPLYFSAPCRTLSKFSCASWLAHKRSYCAGQVFPSAVEAWRTEVGEADALFFSSPEYNYGLTAALKNAIDWASRPPNQFNDKAAAVVSAGGGFAGAPVGPCSERKRKDKRQTEPVCRIHALTLTAHVMPVEWNRDAAQPYAQIEAGCASRHCPPGGGGGGGGLEMGRNYQ